MQRDSIYYLLFSTIHDVLKAEKRLKETTFDFELVPVPRHLSSDCGVCIKTPVSPAELLSLIPEAETERCFVFDGKEYVTYSR